MKLASVNVGGRERAAIAADGGYVLLETLNAASGSAWSGTVAGLLAKEEVAALNAWYREGGAAKVGALEAIPHAEAKVAPPLRTPPKLWGIGANYAAKAEAMAVTPPDGEPICFMKPATSLIGPGDAIVLPRGPERITAEAEIGIVIGRTCKYVAEADAMRVIAGFTPTLDMTAQDIHARNPRFLGRSKCFDTFFSFGPELVTPDECPAPEAWTVETALNGETAYRTDASRMMYSIPFIVAYFSAMMTLQPGDVIMTGTPGSVPLRPGDVAECRLGGFAPLRNPVVAE
ncbi:2-keto-4-pentenoate hydratase/2-oxohepta-3-ene-1,7-dioic acid hydratase (catechol pathway) [Paenibacillus sp. UNC496MF]|uniref:fumarylacetoacetate hydrolase family protein n=1 Tax=Paenibacillus sp. UNC496MF TaxID=1502753 RepID=UPI0008E57C5E|nr:fumarylacetoacetate hydrolase family protein [Paenibacillus sp. UNC496MF]SFJ49622.1 2-keto-4-pentenoate hydratase/2-oxohepta-3-ene-1,7-dioic acid hydratase (catechol pathway) [Paenibacillus sp. UNC496MF]